MELRKVLQVQLEAAERIFGDKTKYSRLLKAYEMWYNVGFAQKHSTHDSIFFIINEGVGFKTIKFYNDGIDYRVSGHVETLSEAYNEAIHTL